jgi:hypothetical protein
LVSPNFRSCFSPAWTSAPRSAQPALPRDLFSYSLAVDDSHACALRRRPTQTTTVGPAGGWPGLCAISFCVPDFFFCYRPISIKKTGFTNGCVGKKKNGIFYSIVFLDSAWTRILPDKDVDVRMASGSRCPQRHARVIFPSSAPIAPLSHRHSSKSNLTDRPRWHAARTAAVKGSLVTGWSGRVVLFLRRRFRRGPQASKAGRQACTHRT